MSLDSKHNKSLSKYKTSYQQAQIQFTHFSVGGLRKDKQTKKQSCGSPDLMACIRESLWARTPLKKQYLLTVGVTYKRHMGPLGVCRCAYVLGGIMTDNTTPQTYHCEDWFILFLSTKLTKSHILIWIKWMFSHEVILFEYCRHNDIFQLKRNKNTVSALILDSWISAKSLGKTQII